MVATSSTPLNLQMAHDAIAILCEKDRLALAMQIIANAKQRASVADLMRIGQVANTTSCELQITHMIDDAPQPTVVDLRLGRFREAQ